MNRMIHAGWIRSSRRRVFWSRVFWTSGPWRGRQLITRLLLLSAVGVALASCSAIKLGYENLPRLTQWQANRYLSLDDNQASQVRDQAASLQHWHRQNLLPVYAEFLGRVEEEVRNPVTVRQVVEWRRTVVANWSTIAAQAAPAVAALALSLRPAQLSHLRETISEANSKLAREYRPTDPEQSRQAHYRRLLDRAEFMLGTTNDAQKRLLRAYAAESAAAGDVWWHTRLARQQAVVGLLDNLATEKPAPAEATRRARELLTGLFSDQSRAEATPGDEMTAALLALATPEQRRRAISRLDGYRRDFLLLAER